MLKHLSIQNFKGITNCELGEFTNINVFIGKNNSGKSTILETIFFARAAFEPVSILDIPVLKCLLSRRVSRRFNWGNEFFYRYNPDNPIKLVFRFDDEKLIPIEVYQKGQEINYNLPVQNDESVQIYMPPHAHDANVHSKIFEIKRTQTRHPLEYINTVVRKMTETPFQKYFVENENDFSFLSKATLIDADTVRLFEDIELKLWEGIRRRTMEKQLVSFLNDIFKANFDDLALITQISSDSGDKKSHIKLSLGVKDFAINIDSFGEGLRDALSILMLTSELKDTILLLEEPDAHLHPEAIRLFFKYLFLISKNNNLQLFITTHSLETLNEIVKLSTDARVFHTSLEETGHLTTRMIDSPDAKLLIDLGTDIRHLKTNISYLVIEGEHDETFLNTLSIKINKKSLKDLPFEVLEIDKNQQKELVKPLALTGKKIIVIQDFDKTSGIDVIVKAFENSLKSKFSEVNVDGERIDIKDTNSQVKVVGFGLPNDPSLVAVGIRNFAMEDYLLKLLCIDKSVQEWAGVTLEELRKRADKMRCVGSLNKSKTLLAAIGVLKDLPENQIIKIILDTAEEINVERILRPIIAEIRI